MQKKKNRTIIVWILGALATVSPFAIDLYLPAFSQIALDFRTTPAQIAISISSYFLGMALGQILYGPFLDRFGRKKPLYAGMALFIAASVSCAYAGSVETLAVLRFVQALGGSVAWVAAVSMVRDFFPVTESARIFSLLVLILGVSPLLAPTFGSFISVSFGWEAIFWVLAIMGAAITFLVFRFLPAGYKGDAGVSLHPKPIVKTFAHVIRHPQFSTYAFSGAFSFATLFIYVAGSPVIFMGIFEVSPQQYGGIFALLSVSFIGGSQLNVFLTRRFSGMKIFRIVLGLQLLTSVVFILAASYAGLSLYVTLALFFICLGCVGICGPNAQALALAPFTRNIGSASALMGFTQLGIAGLASSGVGLLDEKHLLPIAVLIGSTCVTAVLILFIGERLSGQTFVDATDQPAASAH